MEHCVSNIPPAQALGPIVLAARRRRWRCLAGRASRGSQPGPIGPSSRRGGPLFQVPRQAAARVQRPPSSKLDSPAPGFNRPLASICDPDLDSRPGREPSRLATGSSRMPPMPASPNDLQGGAETPRSPAPGVVSLRPQNHSRRRAGYSRTGTAKVSDSTKNRRPVRSAPDIEAAHQALPDMRSGSTSFPPRPPPKSGLLAKWEWSARLLARRSVETAFQTAQALARPQPSNAGPYPFLGPGL